MYDMKKILFIDRDGTILIEPADEQVDSFKKMDFVPGVISALHKIATETEYELVMVSNQDGLGTKSFPTRTFQPVHDLMLKILASENIIFSDIHIDSTLPEQKASTRKPGTGMLEKYFDTQYDLSHSFVIGDRPSDIKLAKNLKCRAIYFNLKPHKDAILTTNDWDEIYQFLANQPRKVEVHRKTNETDIRIFLNLEGKGRSKIKSKLGFLNHMLELFSKHSGIDLEADIKGDLHVDEHHTLEDTAIVLGKALKQALGKKLKIERYGFLLPMDDARAKVAIDFSGRSFLVWKVKFSRKNIGEIDASLFEHFFKSFCDHARCNLYISAKGKNDHHKIEAIFKGFARVVKNAIRKSSRESGVPSTKGIL
jgi:imidazoleglycerol-phosphate dehydratase/histidinol-phosphatase